MKTKNLAIYQGDTHLFKITLSDESGKPLNTDGLSFALAVKMPDGQTVRPELTVDGNIVSLLFSSATTAAIAHQTAEYDLRAISGQYVKTYLRGKLLITQSITPVTAGAGGTAHEENVSVTVAEAAIIRTTGDQSQTAAYDDSAIKQRLTALESRQDQDTVFDDSDLKRRIAALEGRQDQDTVFDDSDLKRRIAALEGRPAPKAESPYSEIQEGYIARENFGFIPENNTPNTVSFPTPFSRRPDIFEACLDIKSKSARFQYIQNLTETGFDIATNYSLDLKGVWFRAAILKSKIGAHHANHQN